MTDFNSENNTNNLDAQPPKSTPVQDFRSLSNENKVAQSPSEAIKPKEVPPVAKRSKQSRNQIFVFMNFMMSCLVFAVVIACLAAFFGNEKFKAQGPLETPQTVVIKEGSGVNTITNQLIAEGVIDGEAFGGLIFRNWVKVFRAQKSMKTGEYLIPAGASMREVMETIRSGKGILHKVSIPEGLTVYQIYERLKRNEILTGELPEQMPAEGSLMPDTYPFQRGATRAELVKRMREAQEKFLASVWTKRIDGLPISTPEEMVILASIVEKETGRADERPHVASVFINRLNRGMKLQSDPTIIYGIFGGKGKPKDRPIFKSDISKPTAYNTYTIPALPPGPIANPGRAALEAVANPSRTEDLFFVANGTGGHVFAKTLDEHNENVARWRAIEKQLKETANKLKEEQEAEGANTN